MIYYTVSKLNGKTVIDSTSKDLNSLHCKFPNLAIYCKKSLSSIYDICGGVRVSLKRP